MDMSFADQALSVEYLVKNFSLEKKGLPQFRKSWTRR
jgi:S-adenosylhomocysteine hydrolase